MGLRCDIFRFGNLQFGASSERWEVKGDYDMDGETVNITHNNADHHEGWYHKSEDFKVESKEFRAYMHMVASNITYTLQQLDDPAYALSNGKSILDSHLVMLGCEMGRHGTSGGNNHAMGDNFHFNSSAGGKLKVGGFDNDSNGVTANYYASCLRGMNVAENFGDSNNNSLNGKVIA